MNTRIAACIAALSMFVSGVAVAASLSGEDTLLSQSWTHMQQASLYQKYKSQNKIEAQKVENYWANGGTAPVAATAIGKALVLEAQAYWSLKAPPPPPADTTAPSAPGGVNATNVTQTSFTLNWNASTDNVGVTGYDVFRNSANVGSTTTLNFNNTGLTCATTYSAGVRAKDAAGNLSATTSVNVTTANCDTPPPTGTLACGSSLDAAYDAAAPGTVVQLANCSYTGKTLTGTKASPGVVFDLAGSNQGTIGLSGAQNVELRNGSGYASLGCQPGTHTLRNYSMVGIYWENVCNVSWIGGSLGPQASDQLNWIFSGSGYGTHDILIDSVYIHDNRCVSGGCHYEAIRIDRGVDGIVIRNSVFRRNAIFHIFVTSLNGSSLSKNITIEHNCFDQPNGGSSVVALHEPIVTSVDPATLNIRVLNNFAETGSNFRGPFAQSSGNTFGPESTCDTWIPGKSTP